MIETPILWLTQHDFEHAFVGGAVLRISYRHYHYTYGTSSYVHLELLTRTGWTTVHSVQFQEGDGHKKLMEPEQAVEQLKEHATHLDLTKCSLPLRSSDPLVWESVEELEHCKRNGAGLLRISFLYLPYSYGTTAYADLKILTRQGWEDLHSICFMEAGKREMSEEAAAEMLKQYASYLYVGNDEPRSANVVVELEWRTVNGFHHSDPPCGSPIRIEYFDLPFSYGTEAYAVLTYIPKRRASRDRRKAGLLTVQYMFNDGRTKDFDHSIARERAVQYGQYLFGDAALVSD